MTTSVPQVYPIQNLKWRIGRLMERSVRVYRETGDIDPLEQATKLARELYETGLKDAGHKGTMDWDYINQFAPALERVEEIVRKRKALAVSSKDSA